MDAFTLYSSETGSDQLHLTVRVDREGDSATAENIFAAIASVLDSRGMRILSERVLGTLDFYETYCRIRKKYRDFALRPFSYTEGAPVHGRGLSGVQIHAVKSASGDNPRNLYDRERLCGSVWKREDSTYIHIAGLHGSWSGSRYRDDQAASMFDAMRCILASQSVDFRKVVRTWISLAGILEWYDAFNAVRTDRFKAFGLIPRSEGKPDDEPACLPASTGVGGCNPAGAFCSGDCLAVSGNVRISELSGMMQPSAYSYGSAFSRGICLEEKDCRQVFVSGTAAIDATGRSLYARNAEAQMVKTLEVVEALIGEKGAKLKDIRSATVYLKRAGDWSVYERLAWRLGLTDLPAVFVVADICRGDLLFEMDALAVID
jgi:enamine deaminase RidA (YjgF/YER057c/UK114 family)